MTYTSQPINNSINQPITNTKGVGICPKIVSKYKENNHGYVRFNVFRHSACYSGVHIRLVLIFASEYKLRKEEKAYDNRVFTEVIEAVKRPGEVKTGKSAGVRTPYHWSEY